MLNAIPLRVEIIWHDEDSEICLPIAETLYKAMARDPYEPSVPGIGLPIFFRALSADAAGPRVYPDTAERELKLVLSTAALRLDAPCQGVIETLRASVAAERGRNTLVEIGLTPGLLDSAALGVEIPAGDGRADRVLEIALLQACRLLGGRLRDRDDQRGAGALKLFISHTKRDVTGEPTARSLAGRLEQAVTERFFDRVSLQPGDDIAGELEANIADAALIAIRTDRYAASPWCRRELRMAREHRRPIIVLDALTGIELQSSELLTNLPTRRLDPHAIDAAALQEVTNFVGLEVLRFLHAERHLALLQGRGVVPANAVALSRAPAAHDLVRHLRTRRNAGEAMPDIVFVHPDPVLGPEDASDIEAEGTALVTPAGRWGRRFDGLKLGISVGSVSEQETLAIGVSELHIADAARVIARSALVSGANLVFGGALELSEPPSDGRNLVTALFEMISTYNRSGTAAFPPLENFVAWPFWQGVSKDWLAQRLAKLRVTLMEAPEGAGDLKGADLGTILRTPRGRCLVGLSLSQMRRKIADETQARIVLGGAREGFLGLLPGIVEELILALDRRQPVYVAGGFGGAAGTAAQALMGMEPAALSLDHQVGAAPGYGETLASYESLRETRRDLPAIDYAQLNLRLAETGIAGLSALNGLDDAENRALLVTQDLDTVVHLMMTGLDRLKTDGRI